MSETAERQELWGGETDKAVAQLPRLRRADPGLRGALARADQGRRRACNAELGLLDADVAQRIAAAGDRIAAGEFDDQFPIDVFQTGSGTSSNMNANEVIATLAGEDVHPNDHVNMGQSSNDVFPSAVHLAALDRVVNDLLPALEQLAHALERKAAEFDDVVKSGRTHLMDAVPVTLGQEFSGYAAQVRAGHRAASRTRCRASARSRSAAPRPAPGSTRIPSSPRRCARCSTRRPGCRSRAPADPFESQAARDGLVEASGALKVVAVSLTKIANDLRLMGSGPRAGLSELFLPELQKGSSIMPGKVNPVIPEVVTQVAAQVIGNDTAITIGGMNGHFELNVYVPLIARNLLQSIALARERRHGCSPRSASTASRRTASGTSGTPRARLSAATALNPFIGYDKASEIVKSAAASGRSLREVAREAGVEESVLDEALDYHRMAKPHG